MVTDHPLDAESRQTEAAGTPPVIHTPDQRVRVFVSSTLDELAPERTVPRLPGAERHLYGLLLATLWLGRTWHAGLGARGRVPARSRQTQADLHEDTSTRAGATLTGAARPHPRRRECFLPEVRDP